MPSLHGFYMNNPNRHVNYETTNTYHACKQLKQDFLFHFLYHPDYQLPIRMLFQDAGS